MERADGLALLDPAESERAAGMGTSAGESHHLLAQSEDRHAHPGGVPRHAPAVANLVQPAHRNPLRHPATSPGPERRKSGNEEPRTCVRGTSIIRFYRI